MKRARDDDASLRDLAPKLWKRFENGTTLSVPGLVAKDDGIHDRATGRLLSPSEIAALEKLGKGQLRVALATGVVVLERDQANSVRAAALMSDEFFEHYVNNVLGPRFAHLK